jgi:propanol-preferring alcohol dehydrogenase
LTPGQTVAVVGIGGLGVLGIQFAKALGLRVVAVDSNDVGIQLANDVLSHLRPDLALKLDDDDTVGIILEFSDGLGVDAAIVCTDNVPATDWALHRLRCQGVGVVLGLPDEGFKFDPFNLVFREITVKGSLHSSIEEVRNMVAVVAKEGICSHITLLPLEQGEAIPERVAAREFQGRLVVTI